MRKPHPTYKIKTGDNLYFISEWFGVDQSLWKRYHNNMCRLTEIIYEVLPPNLDEIYLLPELWDKAEDLNSLPSIHELSETKTNRDVLFGYQNTLPMKMCREILTYNIALVLQRGSVINSIKYQLDVRWLALEDLNHIIEINRISAIYINNSEPDLMADELAIKVARVLYPLSLVVTRENGIVGIHNFAEIQERWQDIRQNLRDYYEGEILEKYLSLNDKVLQNEGSLLSSLKNDWFLHTYFNKIYQTYGSDYSFSNIIAAPIIFDTHGVEYTVKQEINSLIDNEGFINVSMNGEVSDDRSRIDLENSLSYKRYNSDGVLHGEYSAKYQIDSRFNTISKAVLDCNLMLEESRTVSVIINQIKK